MGRTELGQSQVRILNQSEKTAGPKHRKERDYSDEKKGLGPGRPRGKNEASGMGKGPYLNVQTVGTMAEAQSLRTEMRNLEPSSFSPHNPRGSQLLQIPPLVASWVGDKCSLSWRVAEAAEILPAPRNTICPSSGGSSHPWECHGNK